MVMRKLGRQPARLDSLELFRQLDTSTGGLVSDPVRVESFLTKVRAPLSQALSTESTLYGWWAQALFGILVVALNGCELLFTVDSGEVFVDGADVKPADFLVVLRDGRRLLVDVKNIPPSKPTGPIRMSTAEMRGLQRFADLVGAELFIAALFAAMGEWVLVPATAFDSDERGRPTVELLRAFQMSEMSSLGDLMLGVVPPLRLDLLPDESKPHKVACDGTAQFTIGAVEVHVGGELMVDDVERRPRCSCSGSTCGQLVRNQTSMERPCGVCRSCASRRSRHRGRASRSSASCRPCTRVGSTPPREAKMASRHCKCPLSLGCCRRCCPATSARLGFRSGDSRLSRAMADSNWSILPSSRI